MKNFLLSMTIVVASSLFGCTSPSVIMPMKNGVYTLSKSAPTGFTPLGTIRTAAYREINEIANKEGKVVQIISVNEVPAGFARWPQVEIRFSLVNQDQLKPDNLAETNFNSSFSYDATGRPTDSKTTITKESDSDVYSKLEMLGKLRDNGVLTDKEFDREKRKLLN